MHNKNEGRGKHPSVEYAYVPGAIWAILHTSLSLMIIH
jgi:hypothetical protein